jgi:4-amino-4-deoxy-L-arabinose transferase-like glycosyltransferase
MSGSWDGPAECAGAAAKLRFGPAPEIGLAALAGTLFLFHLGTYGLWPDEARYAEIAREMVIGQGLIVPHLNYVAYVEKPPLLYWVTALSFHWFGINQFAARFPSALFAVIGVVAVYLFGLRVFDRPRALLASAILITSPLYALMAQVVTPDITLTALITIALFAIFLGIARRGAWIWVAYGAMGLGVLTKGLVALALPLLAAWVFLLWEGELRDGLKRLRLLPGLALVGAISAWWFILLAVREPGFLTFYFWDEHVRRFLDPTYSHREAFYYYLPVLAAGMAPWSVIGAVLLCLRPSRTPHAARAFCLLAPVITVAFFSAAQSKLAPYILPALPPLALLVADLIVSCASSADRGGSEPASGVRSTARVLAVLSVVMAAAGIGTFALGLGATRFANPYLILVHPSLIASGLILFVGGTISAASFARPCLRSGFAAVVATVALALMAASYGRLEVEPRRSFAAFSREVAARAGDAQIICYGRYVHAMPFYTRRRVILIGPLTELRFGAERASDAKSYFFDSDDALLRLWRQPNPVVVILDQSELNRLRPMLGAFRIIAQARGKLAVMRDNSPRPNNPA